MVDHYRTHFPKTHFDLISYQHDSVISAFMGLRLDDFSDQLDSALDRLSTDWPRAHAFILPGFLHVGLATPTPALVGWLEQFVRDDPAIATVRP